jgi:hypothetical protein
MMKYQAWQKNPSRFRAMTGINIATFERLLPCFESAHDEYLSEYDLSGKYRKGLRRYTMYSNASLADRAERLVFILSYYKLNSVQESHADLFDITRCQCHELIHGLSKSLRMALRMAGCMPVQTDRELQEILSAIDRKEEKVLLHDDTEREISRPMCEDLQQDSYSGKKKKHTVKNALIISSVCLILYVGPAYAGRIHDKTLADTCCHIPSGFSLWQDAGYQGYWPEGVRIYQPVKKPGGRELTKEQKFFNRDIAVGRVRVEYAIGNTRRYRIVKDECRLRKNLFVNHVFHTCAALHNFRITHNPFNYKFKLT